MHNIHHPCCLAFAAMTCLFPWHRVTGYPFLANRTKLSPPLGLIGLGAGGWPLASHHCSFKGKKECIYCFLNARVARNRCHARDAALPDRSHLIRAAEATVSRWRCARDRVGCDRRVARLTHLRLAPASVADGNHVNGTAIIAMCRWAFSSERVACDRWVSCLAQRRVVIFTVADGNHVICPARRTVGCWRSSSERVGRPHTVAVFALHLCHVFLFWCICCETRTRARGRALLYC